MGCDANIARNISLSQKKHFSDGKELGADDQAIPGYNFFESGEAEAAPARSKRLNWGSLSPETKRLFLSCMFTPMPCSLWYNKPVKPQPRATNKQN